MDKKIIDRINELSRKSKEQELTEIEKKEQDKLRKEYIACFRKNLKSQLDCIEFTD